MYLIYYIYTHSSFHPIPINKVQSYPITFINTKTPIRKPKIKNMIKYIEHVENILLTTIWCREYTFMRAALFYSNNNLMQKTEPMQGYHSFHHERTGHNNNKRCLVWTIYLNDIEEGGETEFLYQKKKKILS